MATEGGCCGDGDHHHHHDHEHDEYDDMALMNDPTLMSCCEKDQRAYNKAMELKRVLTEHDPSTQNVRMRQQVVLPPPEVPSVTTNKNAQAQAASTAAAIAEKLRQLDIDESDDSDFDLDDDFEDAMASRRQELAAQFEMRAKNAADGYGIILESDFASFTKELQTNVDIPRVVFVRSSRLDNSSVHEMLKEMLAVASRFLGTKFYSISTSSNSSSDDEALRQLRLTTSPTIVAFRHGQRVDATTIQEKDLATNASILWEARLVPWLTMCNVLEATRQDKPPLDGFEAPKRTTSIKRGDSADEEPAFDCGVSGCRIRYAYEHEHVGPSQESKNEISAWRTSTEPH